MSVARIKDPMVERKPSVDENSKILTLIASTKYVVLMMLKTVQTTFVIITGTTSRPVKPQKKYLSRYGRYLKPQKRNRIYATDEH